MEPWEILGDYRRRNCWGELWFKARPSNSWRSETSTSVLTIQKLQQLSTTLAMPMETWETIAQRRNCWSEPWRSKSSTSALTIQKSQQLSTTSAMSMEPWETIAHRRTCWSELWRLKSSTLALIIQKLQQLSTASAFPMETWETIAQRRNCWKGCCLASGVPFCIQGSCPYLVRTAHVLGLPFKIHSMLGDLCQHVPKAKELQGLKEQVLGLKYLCILLVDMPNFTQS